MDAKRDLLIGQNDAGLFLGECHNGLQRPLGENFTKESSLAEKETPLMAEIWRQRNAGVQPTGGSG